MKQKVIEKIMATHGLPLAIAEQLVDDTGAVDSTRLELALAGVKWGKNPKASADPGLIQALKTQYQEAVDRRDFVAQLSLKRRAFDEFGVLI